MSRWLASCAAALCFLVPGYVSAEEIKAFDVLITPYADGSFAVVEAIEYDFGTDNRHGIIRDILKSHPQPASSWYKERGIVIELSSVSHNEQPAVYEVTETGDTFSIKIGNPDEELTGVQTYTISYRVAGGLSYYDDDITELFWNVTGHEWEVPIRVATARVNAGTDLLVPRRFCYAGPVGSTDSCQTVAATTTEVTFTARNIGLGAGLTIAQELNTKRVANVREESVPWWGVIGTIFAGWLGLLGWLTYRWRTAHKTALPVVSQYEPLPDFKPMFSGVLIDGALHNRDITAGLLYLAEQGFMSIKKTERTILLFIEVPDYEVTLERPREEIESAFLDEVLGLLFAPEAVVGGTVALSKLTADTGKQKANQKAVQSLKHALVEDLTERGYFGQTLSLFGGIWIVIALGATLPFVLPPVREAFGVNPLPFIIVVVAAGIILSFGLQRRTKKGYLALNHLKGFKEFLSVTEKDRYEFHNAPEKSPQQFMEYLPYAVAFGVEDKWAKVFEDVSVGAPSWYEGDSGNFSAVALTHDIGAFSDAFVGTTSSSSSGSSGGGFSGGGAGGGGGSSW